MGTRILAFVLGMLFGIICVFGSLVVVALVLTPSAIYPDSDKFLGDLANLSLYGIYDEISKLYKEKVGNVGENGLYFTLGEFLDRYHIDQITAFGKELPSDLLNIPIFEFLGGSMDNALNQMRASVLFSIVNFIMEKPDEEGNATGGYFSQEVLEKLRAYALADLTNSEIGVKTVFAEVYLRDLLPSVFPADPDMGKLMWALGDSSVGKLAGGFDGAMLLQFKENGALATVGSLQVTELLGGASTYVSAIFGNKAFADLIDDNGNFAIDDTLNNLYVGMLLGYERKVIDSQELTNNYQKLPLETADGREIWASGSGEDTTYAIVADEVTYLAKLGCDQVEHSHDETCLEEDNVVCGMDEHEHVDACFEYVWFDLSNDSHEEHNDSCYVKENEASDVTGKLSDQKIKDIKNFNDIINDMTLRDVLGNGVPTYLKSIQDTKIGKLSEAIDKMYLGEFLGYQRVEITDVTQYNDVLVGTQRAPEVKGSGDGSYAKLDDGKWYPALLNCKHTDEHTDLHTEDCYDFIWYTNETKCENVDDSHEHTMDCYVESQGMMSKLSSERVKNLSNLGKTVKTFTLRDVLDTDVPNSLKSLADTPIGELNKAINNMYLGDFLNFSKKPVEGSDYNNIVIDNTVKSDDNGNYAKLDNDGKWYDAALNCTENHTHDYDCYDYVWYNVDCTNPDDPKCDHSECAYTAVGGLVGRMARLKMDELNEKRIKEEVGETKLGEVIDTTGANGLLKELSEIKLKDMSAELDSLYVGIAMNYSRNEREFSNDDGWTKVEAWSNGNDAIYKKTDEKGEHYLRYDYKHNKYYDAMLICAPHSENEDHKFDCFGFKWYDCRLGDITDESGKVIHKHVHGGGDAEDCKEENTLVKGLNAKMSNLMIQNLGKDMSTIAQNLTMSDLIDSGMMKLGDNDDEITQNEYKLAIIFCGRKTSEGEQKDKCNLAGFFLSRQSSAEDYWKSEHGIDSENDWTPELEAHRDSWKYQSLTTFISTLLNSLQNG